MESKYEEIREKVIKGTKKAVEKIIIRSKKDGQPLVVSKRTKVTE